MKIWIGTGGVPISSEDTSTLGGMKRVIELKLNSMEVEFVRGVKMSMDTARNIGNFVKKKNVRISCHAPYFINLCSDEKKKVEASKRMIIDSVTRIDAMNGDIVVFHPGYYQKLTQEEAYKRVKSACEDMMDTLEETGITDIRLGLETTGKISQFGTVEENIRIAKEVKGCDIVVDWAHIYARNAGRIDFGEILDKISIFKPKHLHTHFSGIEFTTVGVTGKGNEKRHLTIDQGGPNYELLVDEVLKRKIDITFISESPNLEVDAIKLRELFKKHGYKF